MPCNHKFQEYLNLNHLDFNPTTLIVGTFNPEWPLNNHAGWFYGRTNNNYFWDVLPRLYNQESLINSNAEVWKQFCHNNLIAITDLISSIQDAHIENAQHNMWLGNYGDNNITQNFQGQVLVDIIGLLINNPTITNVYLTRGSGEQFWGDIWNPVRDFCDANDIDCKELLTPSSNARFQQGRYNRHNPDHQLNLADFILMRWQQQWHHL